MCQLGSYVPARFLCADSLPAGFPNQGLGYIRHCHMEQFLIFYKVLSRGEEAILKYKRENHHACPVHKYPEARVIVHKLSMLTLIIYAINKAAAR